MSKPFAGLPLVVTDEMRRRFAVELKKEEGKQTPNPGNTCKKLGCDGRIVKQVAQLFRGRYDFHTPACERCGRSYRFAKDAVPVGIEEFEAAFNRPCTI
ncbi:MAG: hypothetical protein AAB794_03515 [Patescibacteria group bacterium]